MDLSGTHQAPGDTNAKEKRRENPVKKKKEQLRKRIKSRPKSRKTGRTKRRVMPAVSQPQGPTPKTLKATELLQEQDNELAPRDASDRIDVMSQVIFDFATPLLKTCQDDEAERKAISLAIFVWNATLLPEEEQKKTLDGYLDNCKSNLPPEEFDTLSGIIHEMVETKRSQYPDNRNKVTNCTFGDFHESRHIEVGYTLA
jgi:hypothetical protein